MLDGPLASADAPHVIETHHLPLHAEQDGSSVQSHSGGQSKVTRVARDVSRADRDSLQALVVNSKFFLWIV